MDCNEDQSCLKNNVKELNEIPTVSLESKDIDLNKTLTVHLENKVKELHSNVRHITQLGMTWFAFFVTTNYLTIGWFAKFPSSVGSASTSCDSEDISLFIIGTVAFVFILQNVLGIVGIGEVIAMEQKPTIFAETV
jgi:hypothetical protein